MNTKYNLLLLIIISCIPKIAVSAIYEFDFTGRLTVLNGGGEIISDRNSAGVLDPYGAQTYISSTLTYDDTLRSGSLGLTIAPFEFLIPGNTVIHDIEFQNLTDNLLIGNMLVDWGGSSNIELTTIWDASGFFNAIENTLGGLQAGDVISGNKILRGGIILDDNIGSATPATDGVNSVWVSDGTNNDLISYTVEQGPAPIVMTTWNYSDGSLYDDGIAGSPLTGGPFPGFNINLDIGSGNSLTLTSVNSSVVPVPAAVWLFSSGVLSLIGINRLTNSSSVRKKHAA